MSLAAQSCALILVGAVGAALASAVLMLASVYEGNGAWAWLWAALFFASSAVAAWCFGELVW